MAMEMRGSLNLSKFYTNPNQPRFYGKALINGVGYEIKGWEKERDGEPWISLLFEQKGEAFEQAKPTALFSKPLPLPKCHTFDDPNDDIPF